MNIICYKNLKKSVTCDVVVVRMQSYCKQLRMPVPVLDRCLWLDPKNENEKGGLMKETIR